MAEIEVRIYLGLARLTATARAVTSFYLLGPCDSDRKRQRLHPPVVTELGHWHADDPRGIIRSRLNHPATPEC